MLKQNQNKMNQKKYFQRSRFLPAFLISVFLVILLVPHLAFAQAAASNDVKTAIQGLFTSLNTILIALQAVLWPILLLIGGLLSNDFLFAGGMQTVMLNV